MKRPEDFPKEIHELLPKIASQPARVNAHRQQQLEHWCRRSKELKQASLDRLHAIKDRDLRRLYIRRDRKTGEITGFFHHGHLALAGGTTPESLALGELITAATRHHSPRALSIHMRAYASRRHECLRLPAQDYLPPTRTPNQPVCRGSLSSGAP